MEEHLDDVGFHEYLTEPEITDLLIWEVEYVQRMWDNWAWPDGYGVRYPRAGA